MSFGASRVKNSALVVAAILVTLLGAEGVLRLADFNQSYWFAARYAYAGSGAFHSVAPGVNGRAPNAEIRHAAVYAVGAPVVEYDYVLRTNNLGFAQTRDIACGTGTLAVFGDSFTEGQGAKPWFTEIESPPLADGLQLANLGYVGTGMLDWSVAYAHYKTCLAPRKVLFVFISHDWFRPNYVIGSGQIDCIERRAPCREPEHLWFAMPEKAKSADLIAATRAREAARWAGRDSWRDRLMRWEMVPKRDSYVFALLRNSAVALFGIGNDTESEAAQATFTRSKAAFTAMVEEIGRENVQLLLLPQADETAAGTPNPQTRAVTAWLAHSGFAVGNCELSNGDYMPNDRHPDAQGYARIADCARKSIEALAAR
jgi:hypothetical protein